MHGNRSIFINSWYFLGGYGLMSPGGDIRAGTLKKHGP